MTDLIQRIKIVANRALKEDADLWQCSLVDLMADNFPHLSLEQIRENIIAADLEKIVNPRLQTEIQKYPR